MPSGYKKHNERNCGRKRSRGGSQQHCWRYERTYEGGHCLIDMERSLAGYAYRERCRWDAMADCWGWEYDLEAEAAAVHDREWEE